MLKKYGPGKIHYDEADAQAVQGTYKYDRFLKTQANLGTYLKSPEHAITYVAAIMNAYAFEAKRVGIELRSNGSSNNNYSDASILATYYNGFKFKGRQINLPIAARYFSERSQTTASDPLKPNDTMGQWVEYNLDFLEAALNTRP